MNAFRMKKLLCFVVLLMGVICMSFTIVNRSYPPTPPSAPGQPMIIDMQFNYCLIRYDEPLDDGGSRVKYYHIEVHQEGSAPFDWQYKGKTNLLTFKVEGLTENERYKFRVTAENAYGLGRPSRETDYITIHSPF